MENSRDQDCPAASMPAKPKVRARGGARLRKTRLQVTVAPACIFGVGKHVEMGCGTPSVAKLVIMAATPDASRSVKEVDQLKPWASGFEGQIVFGHEGMIAAAPAVTTICKARCAPPALKAASPEY